MAVAVAITVLAVAPVVAVVASLNHPYFLILAVLKLLLELVELAGVVLLRLRLMAEIRLYQLSLHLGEAMALALHLALLQQVVRVVQGVVALVGEALVVLRHRLLLHQEDMEIMAVRVVAPARQTLVAVVAVVALDLLEARELDLVAMETEAMVGQEERLQLVDHPFNTLAVVAVVAKALEVLVQPLEEVELVDLVPLVLMPQ